MHVHIHWSYYRDLRSHFKIISSEHHWPYIKIIKLLCRALHRSHFIVITFKSVALCVLFIFMRLTAVIRIIPPNTPICRMQNTYINFIYRKQETNICVLCIFTNKMPANIYTHGLHCISSSERDTVTDIFISVNLNAWIWWSSPCTGICSTCNTSCKVTHYDSNAE